MLCNDVVYHQYPPDYPIRTKKKKKMFLTEKYNFTIVSLIIILRRVEKNTTYWVLCILVEKKSRIHYTF